jgi:hypothetical protein
MKHKKCKEVKKMKNTYKGAIAFGIIAILAISFVAANGFGIGNAFGQLSDEEKEAAKTNMDAIRTAIQDNNYEDWKAAMQEQLDALQAQINDKAYFDELVARHNEMSQVQAQMKAARESGDTQALQQLQEQYGFGEGKGMGKGMKGQGAGMGNGQMHEGNCPMAEAQAE